jgi:hypothetical protein
MVAVCEVHPPAMVVEVLCQVLIDASAVSCYWTIVGKLAI